MAKYRITNEAKREIVALLKQQPAVSYWQLAQVMGIHENTLSKWLRMPTEEQAAEIKAAIPEAREQVRLSIIE